MPTPDVTDGWLEIAGGHRLHYIEAGTGDPVILLHGGIIDSASLSWGATIGPLAESHHVIALDQLGYGQSDAPDVTYSTSLHVDVLADVINQFEFETTTLVGLSLGGAVALGYALRSSERVERLVLVDSHGLGAPPTHPRLTFIVSRLPQLNRLSIGLLRRYKSLIRPSLGNIVHDPSDIPAAVIDELYELVNHPTAGKAYRSWRRTDVTWSGYRTDYTAELPSLAVPTVFLHGAEDEVFPVEYADRAAAAVPNAAIHVFDECGHWPPREVTADFNTVLIEHLAEPRSADDDPAEH